MGEIKATLVLEILGRPAEHLKNALTELIDKLGAEKGIKILDKTVHEPAAVKEGKDLFTSFAEVSVEFETLENYFGTIFAYMPAHIEINSPSKFPLSNAELNEFGNKLLARLHDYDAITKKFIFERNFLINKLKESAPELFNQIVTEQKEKVCARKQAKSEEPEKKPKKQKKK